MSAQPTSTNPVDALTAVDRSHPVRRAPWKSGKVLAGMLICAVLGVSDIGNLFGMNGPEPVAVDIAGGVFGILTVVPLVVAALGRLVDAGIVVAVVARVLSGLLAVPAFFHHVPDGLQAVVAVFLALTLLGVALLAAGLRSPAAA